MSNSEAAPQVVLASQSPSRLSILRSAGVEPLVLPAGVDEDAEVATLDSPTPAETVQHLAHAKARAVVRQRRAEIPEHSLVIGGDSMLLLDGVLQGKPHTAEETIRRWERQRGKVAELITGHAVLYVGSADEENEEQAAAREPYVEVSTTRVHFADVSDRDIAAYAATGEPWECAGAFTLEALGGWFIERIEGDPSSVIGLSLPVIRRASAHFGYPVSSLWHRGALG